MDGWTVFALGILLGALIALRGSPNDRREHSEEYGAPIRRW